MDLPEIQALKIFKEPLPSDDPNVLKRLPSISHLRFRTFPARVKSLIVYAVIELPIDFYGNFILRQTGPLETQPDLILNARNPDGVRRWLVLNTKGQFTFTFLKPGLCTVRLLVEDFLLHETSLSIEHLS